MPESEFIINLPGSGKSSGRKLYRPDEPDSYSDEFEVFTPDDMTARAAGVNAAKQVARNLRDETVREFTAPVQTAPVQPEPLTRVPLAVAPAGTARIRPVDQPPVTAQTIQTQPGQAQTQPLSLTDRLFQMRQDHDRRMNEIRARKQTLPAVKPVTGTDARSIVSGEAGTVSGDEFPLGLEPPGMGEPPSRGASRSFDVTPPPQPSGTIVTPDAIGGITGPLQRGVKSAADVLGTGAIEAGRMIDPKAYFSPERNEEYDAAAEHWKGIVSKIPAPEATGKYARSPQGIKEFFDPKRIYNTLGEQGPLMAAFVASYTANPVVGTVLMAASEGAGAADMIREQERQTGKQVSPMVKTFVPMAVGAFNAALEKAELDILLNKSPLSPLVGGMNPKAILMRTALKMISNPAQETVQEGTQILAKMGVTGKAGEDAFDRLYQSFYGGLVMGAAMTVGVEGTQMLAERKAQDAETLRRVMADMTPEGQAQLGELIKAWESPEGATMSGKPTGTGTGQTGPTGPGPGPVIPPDAANPSITEAPNVSGDTEQTGEEAAQTPTEIPEGTGGEAQRVEAETGGVGSETGEVRAEETAPEIPVSLEHGKWTSTIHGSKYWAAKTPDGRSGQFRYSDHKSNGDPVDWANAIEIAPDIFIDTDDSEDGGNVYSRKLKNQATVLKAINNSPLALKAFERDKLWEPPQKGASDEIEVQGQAEGQVTEPGADQPPVTAQPPASPLKPADEQFIRSRVETLGSVEAVDKFYSEPNASVDKFARQVAREVFGEKTAGAAPKVPESKPAKEPWEMTREEYESKYGKPAKNTTVTNAFSPHKEAVATAINQGRSVPPEVLADYPDLNPPKPSVSETETAAPATASTTIPPRPLVKPNATAIQRDKQLREQQAWDRRYGAQGGTQQTETNQDTPKKTPGKGTVYTFRGKTVIPESRINDDDTPALSVLADSGVGLPGGYYADRAEWNDPKTGKKRYGWNIVQYQDGVILASRLSDKQRAEYEQTHKNRRSGEITDTFDNILLGKGGSFPSSPYNEKSNLAEDDIIARYARLLESRGEIDLSDKLPVDFGITLSNITDRARDELQYILETGNLTVEEAREARRQREKNQGYTDEELAEMEAAYNAAISEDPDGRSETERIDRDAEEYSAREVSSLAQEEGYDEESALREWEEFLGEVNKPVEPPLDTKADLTTSLSDLTDSSTGKTIPAGVPHYVLPDGRIFSRESYKKLRNVGEQEGMFASEDTAKEQPKPAEKPAQKAPDFITSGPIRQTGSTQTSMLDAMDGQEDLFSQPPSQPAEPTRAELQAEAKRLGVSPFGTTERIRARIEAKQAATQPGEQSSSGQAEPLNDSANWEVPMSQEPETEDRINKTEILTRLEKLFGVPIRSKATARWKHAGVYYPQQWIVRMKTWGEIPVAAHEIAHHVDNMMKKKLGIKWKSDLVPKGKKRLVQKELADLDYDQKQRRTSEGFAEFIRYFVTTDEAQNKAPIFYESFTKFLTDKEPALLEKLNEARAMAQTWYKQGSLARVIEHIDWGGEHTDTPGIPAKVRKAWQWVQKHFITTEYFPERIMDEVRRITGKEFRPTADPVAMTTYSRKKSSAIARTFVMEKAIDEAGNVVGNGLKEILSVIPKADMRKFIAFAVSLRALDLKSRGIEPGIDIADARYIIEQYGTAEWRTVADEITEWNNHLLDWVVRAGGLTAQEAKHVRDLNPIYVPFKRAFLDEMYVMKQGGAGGRAVNRGSGVKSIKGSGRPIINPIESMITQATHMIATAQRLRIASLWADIAKNEGVGGFIQKLPPQIAAQRIGLTQIAGIKQILADLGLIDPEEMSFQLDDQLANTIATVFYNSPQYRGKENIVSIVRGGKREFYELAPELYRSLMNLEKARLHPFIRYVFSPAARALRLGATGLKVSFSLIRNPFRDAFTYTVFSKQRGANPLMFLKYIGADITAKPGDLMWRYRKAGGDLAGMMGFDRAATMRVYDELIQETESWKGKTLMVARHPIDALRTVFSFTEMLPRSAELNERYAQLKKENEAREEKDRWSEEDIFVAAFNDAQDVTVNFTRSGYTGEMLNELTAFFNVAIQSPEKMFRAFRADPVVFAVKGLAYITLPTLLMWWWNKDKPWYRNLPLPYKYSNYFIEFKDNVIVRLPMPFELGTVFSAVPVASIEKLWKRDPGTVTAVMEIIQSQMPDWKPSLMGPMYDIWRNKDYLGRPIESEGMKYEYPTERTREYTTIAAKGLSQVFVRLGINLSPVQIDYLMNSYTGGFSRQFPLKEIMNPSDIPILSDILVSVPDNPRRQMDRFFVEYETLSQKEQSEIATEKEIERLGELKPCYNYMTRSLMRLLREAKKEKNQGDMKQIYQEIKTELEGVGIK